MKMLIIQLFMMSQLSIQHISLAVTFVIVIVVAQQQASVQQVCPSLQLKQIIHFTVQTGILNCKQTLCDHVGFKAPAANDLDGPKVSTGAL